MNKEAILKEAKIILKITALDKQINKLRESRAKLRFGRCGSSGLSHGSGRDDLRLDIELGEYLAEFKDGKPTLHSFESEECAPGTCDVVARGTKHYFSYPAQFVGTLSTVPPTHVWAEAHTAMVWASGDPKPVAKEEKAA